MSNHSLLHLAEHSGREARLQRDDLRAMLFPAASRPPTEREIANLRRCLAHWVRQIEQTLLADDIPVSDGGDLERQVFPACWSALTASGLLGDDIFLTAAQNRLFLVHVDGSGTASGAEDAPLASLGRIASDGNPLAADAARLLLAALLRLRSSQRESVAELPAATLNLLVWRVVAAHEVLSPGSRDRMAPRVADMLARHDESIGLAAAAQRLAHRMIEDGTASPVRPELWPERQGLPLTLALLSATSGLAFEQLVDMARVPGVPRLAIVLRGLDYDLREAQRLIGWLAVRCGGEQAAYATLDAYRTTGQHGAAQMTEQFRADWRVHEDVA